MNLLSRSSDKISCHIGKLSNLQFILFPFYVVYLYFNPHSKKRFISNSAYPGFTPYSVKKCFILYSALVYLDTLLKSTVSRPVSPFLMTTFLLLGVFVSLSIICVFLKNEMRCVSQWWQHHFCLSSGSRRKPTFINLSTVDEQTSIISS